MIITEISAQKRRKNRVNIFVDGSFCCGLDSFTVLKYRLSQGMEITQEKLAEIQFEAEKDKALSYAIDYLSKFRKTEKELTGKLVERGYLKEIVDYVIDKTKEYRFISDEDYAQAYHSMSAQKKGARLIKLELKQKGVSDEILSQLVFDDEQELQAIKCIAEKFFEKNENTRENKIKLTRRLASKGFSFDQIKKAVAEIEDEEIYDD